MLVLCSWCALCPASGVHAAVPNPYLPHPLHAFNPNKLLQKQHNVAKEHTSTAASLHAPDHASMGNHANRRCTYRQGKPSWLAHLDKLTIARHGAT